MSIETNRFAMQRFLEFINTASPKMADELIASDATFFVPGRTEPMRGPAGYMNILGMMRGGFPDIQWTLEETIAEGNKVAARFSEVGRTFLPFARRISSTFDLAQSALSERSEEHTSEL